MWWQHRLSLIQTLTLPSVLPFFRCFVEEIHEKENILLMLNRVENYQWVYRYTPAEDAQDKIKALANGLNAPELLAQVLVRRGYDDLKSAQSYLYGTLADMPDPMMMKGMAEAVDHLEKAIKGNEPLLLSGDFDSDGTHAVAILGGFLQEVGAKVRLFVPDRIEHGYGLAPSELKKAAQDGFTTVVSVDCGIAAFDEADLVRELNMTLIVTDHHQVQDRLPDAIIINPHQSDCPYPHDELCGASVALMLAIVLRKRLRETGWFTPERPEPDLNKSLDMAAFATIADLVPMVGLNRPIVRYGLNVMNQRLRPGYAALMEESGIDEATTGKVGFQLAPRANSAGRLENASQVVDLLLSRSIDEAMPIVKHLGALNSRRQDIEQQTTDAAEDLIREGKTGSIAIILGGENFHQGVQGISASTLVELYHRPTILISWDLETGVGKGSGRSIPGFNLVEAIGHCKEYLLGFGGHAMAAGLSLHKDQFEEFSNQFSSYAQKVLTDELLVPVKKYDAEIQTTDISLGLVEDLKLLEPYGIQNPAPVFLLKDCEVIDYRLLKEKHLKFTISQGHGPMDGIGFSMAHNQPLLESGRIDLLAQLDINEWRGSRKVQLLVKDIKLAGQ